MRPMIQRVEDGKAEARRAVRAGERLLSWMEKETAGRGPGRPGIETAQFGKGDLVYAADDRAAGVYVVVSGRVKIFRLSMEGREIILRILGKGDLFGEDCLMVEQSCESFAEAIATTELRYIARDLVIERMGQDAMLGMALFEIAGARLQETQKLAERLAFDAVTSRVANLLLESTENKESRGEAAVTLESGLTHQQMAGMIGTTRETFTSTISQLAAAHIVKPQRRRLEILGVSALQSIA
jgi:CRP-like cAMP-binding protein